MTENNLRTAFVNGTIISSGSLIRNYALLINENTLEEIIPITDLPDNIKRVNVNGSFICPGFIDLQIMGAGGALFGGNPSIEALDIMEAQLIKEGVIRFLPTVSTNDNQTMEKAISSAVEFRKSSMGNFMGLHLEGPYINPDNRGAHPETFIRTAQIQEIEMMLQSADGEIKMFTLAPELQGEDVLNYLETQRVVTAMGHTGASYEQAKNFLAGKRKAVTHLYNGMPTMHHRKPGPIPAIFQDKPYTSIVVDGIHVDYQMVAMAKQILGEFLYLISDAATPCISGIYQHTDNLTHYVTQDANGNPVLSGSKLTMMQAIRNCVEHVGITLQESINMCTLYPARLMGLDHELGLLKSGRSASFVVFNSNYEIESVYFKGKSIDGIKTH